MKLNCPCKSSAQAGFTLIEVLISIALLAVLSLLIYQTTSSTFSLNTRLSAESSDATSLLLGLQTIESDLTQIYTPVIGPASPPPNSTESVQAFWSAPVRADGYRRARFVGSTEKVSFVANNNLRVEEDSPQSDFQKITWELDRGTDNTYTLYRTNDWDAFRYKEDNAEKPKRMPILERLSSAKFSFYRLSDKSWQDQWDSESNYAKEESRFPDLIRLKIEGPDPTNNANQLAWEIVVRPNLALNYLDEKTKAAMRQRFE